MLIMNLFEKLKQKSVEKMLEKMAGSSQTQDMLKNMGASPADLSSAMESLKGMNMSALMGMFQTLSQGGAMTGEKIRKLMPKEALQQAAIKLNVPVDQASEKMAEMFNQAMAQFRPPK